MVLLVPFLSALLSTSFKVKKKKMVFDNWVSVSSPIEPIVGMVLMTKARIEYFVQQKIITITQ